MTLIVPFPPGSATDSVTRHLAESIRAATKAVVVVENKPGADGNLAPSFGDRSVFPRTTPM
jgi:tripartite-type tricarboxylate transporter receptor subunit TctC